MKTFKELLNEVAEPVGGDEKRFKDKHVVAKTGHPVAGEDQFKAKTNKKKRLADTEDGEDEDLYESHFKVGDEVECIKSGMEGVVVEVDPEEKGKYYTVKREDGKLIKYAPDELRAEDDDEDEDLEEEMSASQTKKREEIVKSMKDKKAEFQDKYGDKWKSVMYATATKQAMKESVELDEAAAGLGQHPALKKAGIEHKWHQSSFKRSKTIVTVANKNYERAVKALGDDAAVAGGNIMVDGDRNFKESVDLSESVIDDLKKIVSSKTRADVKFSDGNRLKVDMTTASTLLKLHDSLNSKNQQTFANAVNKDETGFMKMVDFAFSKVK